MEFLSVLRPPDDDELPDVWGLPATTLRSGEDWEGALERAGLEKLGVELNPGPELNRGGTERPEYQLHMRLYEAEIRRGEPEVPQPVSGMTQYVDWEWAGPERLMPSVRAGSLCSRLFLEHLGLEPRDGTGSSHPPAGSVPPS